MQRSDSRRSRSTTRATHGDILKRIVLILAGSSSVTAVQPPHAQLLILSKAEFVDVWTRENQHQHEHGHSAAHSHWPRREQEPETSLIDTRSVEDSSFLPASDAAFLLADTAEIAASFDCDPQPWVWQFESVSMTAVNTTAIASPTLSAESSPPATSSRAQNQDLLSVADPDVQIVAGSQMSYKDISSPVQSAVAVLASRPASSSTPGAVLGGNGSPPLLAREHSTASTEDPTQSLSPLRRKLSSTRPRALQAASEDSPDPLHSSDGEAHEVIARRSSQGSYAVDRDNATLSWLSEHLNLYQGKVSIGDANLRLAPDPLAASGEAADTILSVFYPQGSYAPSKSDPIGGASFYAQPFLGPNNLEQQKINSSAPDHIHYRSTLVLQYSVAFPSNFDFVKGGKLPGEHNLHLFWCALLGLTADVSTSGVYSSVGLLSDGKNLVPLGELDANTDACSGGARAGVGQSCWSARVMWRQGGMGEVYAYFPTDKMGEYDPCRTNTQSMICNDAYGTSIGRGTFTFIPGQYTNLTLAITLNSQPTVANGELHLWANGQHVIDQPNMLWRTGTVGVRATGRGGGSGDEAFRVLQAGPATQQASTAATKRDASSAGQQGAQWVDKVFFSTFFGGSTADYGATKDEEAYFKDFALYSGTRVSSAPGLNAVGSSSGHRACGPSRDVLLALGLTTTAALAILSIS
ncbi:hypothetical protein V8E36_001064 [Tilletia maclaganii]